MTTKSQMTVRQYLDQRYTLYRAVSDASLGNMQASVKTLDAWLGRPVRLSDLTDEFISTWLRGEEANGKLAPKTIHTKRADVLTLWRHAHRAGLVDQGPNLVRPIRVPRKNPQAWTEDELGRLFAAAKELPGVMEHGAPRGLYFWALLKAGYETGLRRADLMRLRTDEVRDDGLVVVTLHKTQLPHVAQMRLDTVKAFRKLAAILEVHENKNAAFPLHWPHSKRLIYWWLEKIRDEAGVPDGALHQLRRSGATACEARLPGSATAYLAHSSPTLAAKCYIDRTIVRAAILPPETPKDVRKRRTRSSQDAR